MSGQDKVQGEAPSINDVEHAADSAWIEERARVMATWHHYPVAAAFVAAFDEREAEEGEHRP